LRNGVSVIFLEMSVSSIQNHTAPLISTEDNTQKFGGLNSYFSQWLDSPLGVKASSFYDASRSHFRHTTLGRTPLDEGPARRTVVLIIINIFNLDLPF
jgi:hypothetical protein